MGLASYSNPSIAISPIKLEDDGYRVDLPDVDKLPADQRSTVLRRAWRKWLDDTLGPPFIARHEWQMDTGETEKFLDIDQRCADVAASVQSTLTDTVVHLAKIAVEITGCRKLVLGGGVALNCGANGHILHSGIVDDLYIFPAAHDAGGAVGAALYISAQHSLPIPSRLDNACWGPSFTDGQISATLENLGLKYEKLQNTAESIAQMLAENRCIGLFQGRMEVGPRALGHRSILANPISIETRDRVNKIKKREHWRPLSPSILAEDANDLLINAKFSPFMLCFFRLRNDCRSMLSGVAHVDGTCRPQIVDEQADGELWQILSHWKATAGVPAILNTSFNLRDEPIVCTPLDAIRTFFSSELDALVIGSFLLKKTNHKDRL